MYRDDINSLQIHLSRTQAGPGRAVKEQQEQNSPNHVQRINLISVIKAKKKSTRVDKRMSTDTDLLRRETLMIYQHEIPTSLPVQNRCEAASRSEKLSHFLSC